MDRRVLGEYLSRAENAKTMAGELRKAHNLTDTVDQISEGLMATGRYINKSKLYH